MKCIVEKNTGEAALRFNVHGCRLEFQMRYKLIQVFGEHIGLHISEVPAQTQCLYQLMMYIFSAIDMQSCTVL